MWLCVCSSQCHAHVSGVQMIKRVVVSTHTCAGVCVCVLCVCVCMCVCVVCVRVCVCVCMYVCVHYVCSVLVCLYYIIVILLT